MFKTIFKSKMRIAAATIVVLVVGGITISKLTSTTVYNFIEVKKGSISEEVIVTGKTTPVDKLDLSFERGGKVARARVDVGNTVVAGQILAELDATEASASLLEAEANARVQRANLDELIRGTRLEDIQITKTQLAKAEQNLVNEYNGVSQTLNDAYAKTDDAIRNQLSSLFTNGDGTSPQLTFSASDPQAQIDAQAGRATANTELNLWRAEILNLNGQSSKATLDGALKNTGSHLTKILAFLNRTMDALISSPSAIANTYKTNLTTARAAVNTAILNINTKTQNIASLTIAVEEANNNLSLQLAGATKENLDAQTAQVAQADASISLARAQLNQTILRTPLSGVVTKMDAKVGEVISAHTVLASVISEGNFEIEANIPEVDIGKIAIGNNVSTTFDAFPDETFSGRVAKIDPAETVIDGVVNFKTVVVLTIPNSKIKSGLTANLSIETRRKNDVLVLPQEAIIEKKEGVFVKKYENGTPKEYSVTVGLRDKNGNAEILSGVVLGEKVINIGLKTSQ